jgi:hypothetical protein
MTSVLSASRQQISQLEKEQARAFVKQSQYGLVGAVTGLSDAQWNYEPGEGQWSIAQIVEHSVFVIERVAGPTRQAFENTPLGPAGQNDTLIDSIVLQHFPNRWAKFKSPEFALPYGRFSSLQNALPAIESAYAGLFAFLENAPDLRGRRLESPPLRAVTNGEHNAMDAYQWILAAAAHTERHIKQILELKSKENFPAC